MLRRGWLLVLGICHCAVIGVAEPVIPESARSYWAFQPVQRPEPPRGDAASGADPIDAFVRLRLQQHGLTPSPAASKTELLRRAKFDLLGLPPTPEETQRFLADDAPDAYERMIDELLASPRYGETWGRHWLDLVRYAETAGFNADPLRPLAYKYRDYVIDAFNADTPYDRFIYEQIAGDEMFPNSERAVVATGYNVMWADESNASDVLLARQEALNDLTGNVGAVFLGLSIGCAQCHDHKFDPILQTDFYQLQAFFAGIVPVETAIVATHEQRADYLRRLAAWSEQSAALRDELHALERSAKVTATAEKRLKFPDVVLAAIDTHADERSALQRQLAFWSERQILCTDKELEAQWSDEQKQRRKELQQKLQELEAQRPQPAAEVAAWMGAEVQSRPPETHLLAGGSYSKPLQPVEPGFPVVMSASSDNAASVLPPRDDTSGRRTALAQWLTDPANPLTARVMVNRLWQGHFGRGIVATANDFGKQGEPPTHPELLDWLASEFIARGWSIKSMHRLIMTSETYRQRSDRRGGDEPVPAAIEIDPENTLYWHFPRRRLSAEAVRDAMLAAAGRLNTTMYGPGVQPELPPNFSARHGWKPSEDEAAQRRRSVYIHAKRNLPYPLLDVFDLPDMHESCARRSETTVAPQALMLLNSEMIQGYAAALADQLLRERGSNNDAAALVRRAYLYTLAREPNPDETAAAIAFLRDSQSDASAERRTAVIDFCHALFNANEFLYLD